MAVDILETQICSANIETWLKMLTTKTIVHMTSKGFATLGIDYPDTICALVLPFLSV